MQTLGLLVDGKEADIASTYTTKGMRQKVAARMRTRTNACRREKHLRATNRGWVQGTGRREVWKEGKGRRQGERERPQGGAGRANHHVADQAADVRVGLELLRRTRTRAGRRQAVRRRTHP